jgi:hypothetical protein
MINESVIDFVARAVFLVLTMVLIETMLAGR